MTCQKDKEKRYEKDQREAVTTITVSRISLLLSGLLTPYEADQREAVTTITGEQQKCAKSEDHITISKEAVSQLYNF